jgi:hypothetical protein
MASRWGVSQVRVADLATLSISRLEERVGWLGRERVEEDGWVERDEPDEEESRG